VRYLRAACRLAPSANSGGKSAILSGRTCSPFAALIVVILVGTASAAGSFDGTYKGSETVVVSNNKCFDHGIVLIIQNNHFNMRHGLLSVDVAADGTFKQAANAGSKRSPFISIEGKITGASLEADITISGVKANDCAYHWSLRKS
jgi:hypothetical protein